MKRTFRSTPKALIVDELSARWGHPVELRSLGGYLGRNQIFEVMPKRGVIKLFHHEPDLRAEREAQMYRLLEPTAVPVAALLDEGRIADGTPWIYVSYVEGLVLEEELQGLNREILQPIFAELGSALSQLHDVALPGGTVLDGKPAVEIFASARTAVLSRGEPEQALFEKASERYLALRPVAFDRRARSLVHRDVSARNTLIAPAAGGASNLAALIDFELALIADPIEDIAKLAFKEFERCPVGRGPFLTAYQRGRPFDDCAQAAFVFHLIGLVFEITQWAADDDRDFYDQAIGTLERLLENDPVYTLEA